MAYKTWVSAALVMMASGRALAEKASVLKVTDMRGTIEYRVATHEEYTNLLQQVKEEAAVFAPIALECKKEWQANKDNKFPFPGSSIKPRAVTKVSDFPDADKAEKKRSSLQDRYDNGRNEEAAALEKKNKAAKVKQEDLDKEVARAKAADTAYEMVTKKMGDKLGRPIEGFGVLMTDAKKEEPKKEEPKKEEGKKKEDKKAEH